MEWSGAWFITPENVFLLLQSPMAESFTPPQQTLGLAHADLRLVCGCSAMETHFIKLPTNSSCAEVASRASLKLGSECCNRGQMIFTCFSTQWPHYVSLCGLPLYSGAVVAPRYFHFKITALTVAGQTFDKLTFWKGGILWQSDFESHWALQ